MFDKNKIAMLYPGAENLMIKPMLIHASTDAQLRAACDSGKYFGQFKKDGALYMFVKGRDGQCYLFGRTISKKTELLTEKIDNVPHIKDALAVLPNNTIILGEIYYPGGSSRNTTEIMGCLPDKAIDRQLHDKGLIHYYIYDILQYDGIDFIKAQTDNWTRYKIVSRIYQLYHFDQYNNFLELAKIWEDNLYARVGQALAQGEEGMVIKLKSGIYEPDKRPLSNLKAKRADCIDAIIMGFEAPTKEYYGKEISTWSYWIDTNDHRLPLGYHSADEKDVIPVTKAWYKKWMNSRIIVGAYDQGKDIVTIGTISSGISDEIKEDMTLHPDKYLNQVVKIQCMEKDKCNHTLRHGFYIGLHEEKNPEDCILDIIF